MPGTIYCVKLPGSELGLAAGEPELEVPVLRSPAPCQWEVSKLQGDWYRLQPRLKSPADVCLDLLNPEQQPCLQPPADVSGQMWSLKEEIGCRTLEGGAVARCVIGYKMTAMWTGTASALTGRDGKVTLSADDGGDGQVWEIVSEDGIMWMAPGPTSEVLQVAEPEIISCDFGHRAEEPELVALDAVEVHELVDCDVGGFCGGVAMEKEGGPTELLNLLRKQIEEKGQLQAPSVHFTCFEPVRYRTQVVAGVNYFCKVHIGNDVHAHIAIFEPLPGQGPPELTDVSAPWGPDDPIRPL